MKSIDFRGFSCLNGCWAPLERKKIKPPWTNSWIHPCVLSLYMQYAYSRTTQSGLHKCIESTHYVLCNTWSYELKIINFKFKNKYISFVLNHWACHAIHEFKIESTLAISLKMTQTAWTKGLMVGVYINTMKTTFLLSFDF